MSDDPTQEMADSTGEMPNDADAAALESKMFVRTLMPTMMRAMADTIEAAAAGELDGFEFMRRSEAGYPESVARSKRILAAALWARGEWVKPDPEKLPATGVYRVRGAIVAWAADDDHDLRLTPEDRLYINDGFAGWAPEPEGIGWVAFVSDCGGLGGDMLEYWSVPDPEVE